MSISGIRAGLTYIELGVVGNIDRPLRAAQQRVTSFGNSVQAMGRKMLGAGLAVGAALTPSVMTYANFADQMSIVGAVSGATASQFAKLQKQAEDLGATTSFTASQVAGAQTELARAGFKPQEILDATEATLSLARATASELPRATEIGAAALRSFRLDASEMGRVSDVLAAGANNSAQTLEDLGEGLKPVAPLAKAAGASLEETVASLAVLANNGIKGSLAGNALARAYKNLSTSLGQKKLRELGVEAVDAEGNLRPLSTILAELDQATKGMGSAERLAAFDQLFGRGQAAALNLADPASKLDDMLGKIQESAGLAGALAKQMDDNVGGVFRMAASAIESVSIAIGKALNSELREGGNWIAEIALKTKEWIDENQGLVITITKIAAIVAAAGAGLIVFGAIFTGLGTIIGGIISIFGGLISLFGLIGGAASAVFAFIITPAGAAVAAIAAIATAVLYYSGVFGKTIDFLKEKFATLSDGFMPAIEGIVQALQNGQVEAAAKIFWSRLKLAFVEGLAAITGQTAGVAWAKADLEQRLKAMEDLDRRQKKKREEEKKKQQEDAKPPTPSGPAPVAPLTEEEKAALKREADAALAKEIFDSMPDVTSAGSQLSRAMTFSSGTFNADVAGLIGRQARPLEKIDDKLGDIDQTLGGMADDMQRMRELAEQQDELGFSE